jgi:hypothetical protein
VYSTNNLFLSISVQLADMLRADGWNVYWQVSATTDTHTAGGQAKGTISLVKKFPANPNYIITLNDEDPGTDEEAVVIPALTVVLGHPIKIRRYQVGSSIFWKERSLIIAGLVESEYQQPQLADLLQYWIDSDTKLEVWDYDTNPTAPPPLEDAWVEWARVESGETLDVPDAARYFVRVEAGVRYLE